MTDHRRKPDWFKVKLASGRKNSLVGNVLAEFGMHTICEEGLCPNRAECWSSKTASFLILGDTCTRNCQYCHVKCGKPGAVDQTEPDRLASAAAKLGLKYAVITSVTRDDLPDGGASVYVRTVLALRDKGILAELLIPDFRYNYVAIQEVADTRPAVIGHNIETVRRVYPTVRKVGTYEKSLGLLKYLSETTPVLRVKSAMMVGLGETRAEISETLRDLRQHGCQIVAVGQYLQPTREHVEVSRFYTPGEFAEIKEEAMALGFRHVESGPLVRSSYHAERAAGEVDHG